MELHEITSKSDRIAEELRKLEDRKADLLTAERVWQELEGAASFTQEAQPARPGLPTAFELDAYYQERLAKAYFGVSVDLTDAGNNVERAIVIAKATGQNVHPMTLAGFFLGAGISSSPVPNNRSHIFNDLKRAEADFEYVKKEGSFRYKGLGEGGEESRQDSYESATELAPETLALS